MKTVEIPVVDGEYTVLFPPKCVYCGAPEEVTVSETKTDDNLYVKVDVPYCSEHARQSRESARTLMSILVLLTLFNCGALFIITTSINRKPPVILWVFLALLAVGLAYIGRELFRRWLSRSRPTMTDMMGGLLGIRIVSSVDAINFSFVNDNIAEEFALLNGQELT